MDKIYTVLDDFYLDPYLIRKQALETAYFATKESSKHLNTNAPWPGKISQQCFKPKNLDRYVSEALGKIVISSPPIANTSGFFRISKKTDMSSTFCHVDSVTEMKGKQYAGVLYLSDSFNTNTLGTLFYKHKQSNLSKIETNDEYKIVERDFNDENKWELIDSVDYQFNRLVLYDASTVHSIGPLFGNTDSTARLTQIFMFSEIPND